MPDANIRRDKVRSQYTVDLKFTAIRNRFLSSCRLRPLSMIEYLEPEVRHLSVKLPDLCRRKAQISSIWLSRSEEVDQLGVTNAGCSDSAICHEARLGMLGNNNALDNMLGRTWAGAEEGPSTCFMFITRF